MGFPPGVTTDGDTAVMIANGNVTAGTVNTIYSPAYSTQNLATSTPTPALMFDMAYSRRNSSGADDLKISFSANCGQTWAIRRTISGTNLSTTGTQNIAAFVPQSAAQWRTETVNLIGPYFNQSSMMVRFETTAQSGGNNLYLDNIRLEGRPLGAAEELAAAGVALAPRHLSALGRLHMSAQPHAERLRALLHDGDVARQSPRIQQRCRGGDVKERHGMDPDARCGGKVG